MSFIAPFAVPADNPNKKPRKQPVSLGWRTLQAVASLRLTVVLFALSMVLVFFATVAMMTKGLWTVVDEYFRSFVVWIPVDLVRRFGTVFLTDVGDFPKDGAPWRGKVPFPAGWTIGFLMLGNLLAAHLVRFKLSWKRSGIILLHGGVILLMLGELVTGLYAVESTMTIKKGETSDFLDVTREVEIAVTDSSDPNQDRVTVVSQAKIARPGLVSHPDLPFDLRIEEYWRNTDKDDLMASDMAKPEVSADPNVLAISSVAPMIKGVRLSLRTEAAGVDGDARSDIPTVRVKVLAKGTQTELGQFLLSLWSYQNFEQNRRLYQFPDATVTVDGKAHTLQLRNKRVYTGYEVELLNFEHGKYPGTDIPKDFASTVRVKNKADGDTREVRIWMNNPLRYADVSMYQHAVVGNDSGTVLQVVKNPARFWPYLACAMITLGMFVHFGINLYRFLSKPTGPLPVASADSPRPNWIPWVVNGLIVVVCLGWVGSHMRTPKPSDKGIDWYELGKLPVRDAGRVMPLDTLARTTLQSISDLTEVKVLEGTEVKTKATAIQWLADVLDNSDWRSGPGAKHQVFRIEHDQVLAKLELPRRPGFFRYSIEEMRGRFDVLNAEYERVQKKQSEQKAVDLYDTKIRDLAQKISIYQRLVRAGNLELIPPSTGADWSELRAVDKRTLETIGEADREKLIEKMDQLSQTLTDEYLASKRSELARLMKEYGTPDKMPEEVISKFREEREQLKGLIETEKERVIQGYLRANRGANTPAGRFTAVLNAAREGRGDVFRTALDAYRENDLVSVPPIELRKVSVEAYWLDHVAPFYYAEWLYGIAAALALFGWLFWRPLNAGALAIILATFTLHTFALGLRMWIHGRPPVTNLYASAVYIGWGCVFLGLILEAIFRNGVANVVGGVIGLATCKVAYFLGGSGDTMKMLVAVLDTNFWLTVHVLTVTTGYMATFKAGGFATTYLILRAYAAVSNRVRTTRQIDLSKYSYLPRMTYGVLCFATLLSFFGTVSGGIWADESWGRFWGWDPKENGAVLIVVWNTLILHARWCGWVKDRGVAVLAVAGNMVTAWSWFGTNQLQIGLHSYGFDNRLASGCFWFWVAMAGVMLLGLIPNPKSTVTSTTLPRARRV